MAQDNLANRGHQFDCSIFLRRVDLDFELFWWSFDGFQFAMLGTWLPMQLSALFVVYYGFKFWAVTRQSLKSTSSFPFNLCINETYLKITRHSNFLELFDLTFGLIYIGYLGLLITLPIIGVNQVSLACRIIILMEQVRLLMKSHAFVRSNIPKALKHTDSSEKSKRTRCRSSW